MKEEILSIASDLREGFITSNEAQELLLVLFGVSKSAKPKSRIKVDDPNAPWNWKKDSSEL